MPRRRPSLPAASEQLAQQIALGALALVMVVAMTAAGPNLLNGTVFVSSVVIVCCGTGRYSIWDPDVTEMNRVVHRLQNGGV